MIPPAPNLQAQSVQVETERPRRRRHFSVAVGTFVVLTVVVSVTMAGGRDVCKVDFAGSIEFCEEEVTPEQIIAAQTETEKRLDTLESEAVASAQDAQEPATVNLSGQWQANNGLTYVITQYGSEAVIAEYTAYGITATGYGTVDSRGFVDFQYQAVDGSVGTAYLELMEENHLVGQFASVTGSWPVELWR